LVGFLHLEHHDQKNSGIFRYHFGDYFLTSAYPEDITKPFCNLVISYLYKNQMEIIIGIWSTATCGL